MWAVIFYNNALVCSSRILTDFSASHEYTNLTVNKAVVSSGMAIRPTGVRTTALTIRSENSAKPLTIQNSSLVPVCTIYNNGNINCPAIAIQSSSSASACTIDNNGNI